MRPPAAPPPGPLPAIDGVAGPPAPLRVALLGFSPFERSTLASVFRLAASRRPSYELVPMFPNCDFVVADADHPPSVAVVMSSERGADTVFIGVRPPPEATAWMPRPIDPLHVLRELDAMAAARGWIGTPAPGLPPRPVPQVAPLLAQRGWPQIDAPAEEIDDGIREERPDEPAVALEPAAPVGPPPPRALLVDDSEIALHFLASRLAPWGLQCDLAGTSARAIELLAHHDYDCVFVDVELGEPSELDGYALCQHIRRRHAGRAPALLALVSAHRSELDRARGTLAGADAYLGKPLQADELARLLRRQGLKPPPDLAVAAAPARSAVPRPPGPSVRR